MSAIGQASGEQEPSADDGSRPEFRALLLQDERFPNLSLVQAIAEVGFVLIGPLTDIAQAIEWVERDRPDIVILDMALSDGVSFELADELHRRNIPFLFYTSWRDSNVHPVDLEGISLIGKPLGSALVVKLLSNIIKGRQAVETCPHDDLDQAVGR
jgi:DNA-binding response OmpR family regulator